MLTESALSYRRKNRAQRRKAVAPAHRRAKWFADKGACNRAIKPAPVVARREPLREAPIRAPAKPSFWSRIKSLLPLKRP